MTLKKNRSIIAEEMVNNLRRLFQVVNEQSKNAVSDSGLTGPQLWALKVLFGEAGQPVTVSGLARLMCLNSSTVVRILDALESRALVQRVRSVSDRRIVYVSLTRQGQAMISQSPDVAQNVLIKGLKSLSENKLHTIANGLAQLVNSLDTHTVHT